MHIAYLTSEFMTEKWHGGLAAYLDNITSIMSENGHDVTIITLSEKKIGYTIVIKLKWSGFRLIQCVA